MRKWYLALVISNTQSFVFKHSNFDHKHAVLRCDLEPSPAMHSENEEWNGVCSSGKDFIFIYIYIKQKQAITDNLLYRYNSQDKIFLRIDYMYHKISAECLVIGFAYL